MAGRIFSTVCTAQLIGVVPKRYLMASDSLFKEGVAVCGDKLTLKVSRDCLEAVLTPRGSSGVSNLKELDLDLQALRLELRTAGVRYGFLEKPELRSDGSCCIARGIAAVNGENARIKTYVRPGIAAAPKAEDPLKDKVDFHEMGAIVNVPKDKLLLEKVPLTLGEPGRAVTDELLSAKPGKDITIKVGPGVTLSEDGCKGYSAVEGKFVLVEGKPAVLVEHTVNGDIDFSVGNISFVGQRLAITGTIQPGFKVKCKGDITLGQGVQYSAEITAGGNLEIKGGVIGRDIVIKCWGNVTATFMDNVGRVEVKGDLTVTDFMAQVRAMVGGNIRVLTGQGILAGGHYIVGGSVFVKDLGSTDEVTTELSVGINPLLDQKKVSLDQEKGAWSAKMNELLRNTTGLKVMQKEKGSAFPPAQAELLKKYVQMLPQIMERVNKLTEEQEALEVEMERAANESIYVYGTLYPGAKITIGGVTRVISTLDNGVVIHFDKENRQIHCRAMTPEEKQVG
jgi:uncharacterized protein (DUF342 family)